MADKSGKRLIFGKEDLQSKKVFADPGAFVVKESPEWLKKREQVWDKVYAKHVAKLEKKEKKPIKIVMPDGAVKEGTSWVTTPMDIALGISKGLAKKAAIAQLTYTEHIASLSETADADGLDEDSSDEEGPSSAADAAKGGAGKDVEQEPVLWDMLRPFEGSCKLELLDFDSHWGKQAAWHSSAHILGQ